MKNKHQAKFLKYILNPIFVGILLIFFVFLISFINFLSQAYSMITAPSQEVKAVVDSKFLQPNLFGNKYFVTLESDKLPYGKAYLDVSPMQYAGVAQGDATCVRFKSTREYPQYKEEFLYPSDCAGSK